MRKIFLLFTGLLFFIHEDYAQDKTDMTLSRKDSLEMMQDLMSLLDSADKPASYVFLNAGIGNRLFSIRNNALNAKQSTTNTLIYSPSVGYFHKSGFSLTAGANFLNDGDYFGVKQYSVTPAFDLANNKTWDVGLSYTHYFVRDTYSPFSSPIQNDWYASFKYKKTWLQPGISFGYSTGRYNEALYKDTVVNGTLRHRYDSVTNNLSAFSVMASVSHQFTWYNLISHDDGLGFTPTLMLNAGSSQVDITHKSNAALVNFFLKRKKIPRLQTEPFELQSIGLNLDLTYSVGNFTFEPQFYMDYYLPKTSAKRLSEVFVFNVGYTF